MKRIIFLLFIVASLGACSKKSSPNKIERLLVGEKWKLEKWIDNNVNISDTVKNFVYEFNDSKEFISRGVDSTVIGSWDTQDRKNPAVLILSIAVNARDGRLGDDWNVIFLTKDEFRLERVNDPKHPNDECIFKRL